MTCDPRQLLAAARHLCGGFRIDGQPVRTGTSLLLPGHIAGTPVLAKHPADPRRFWQDRCRQEITVYHALASGSPAPVLTPALVAADPDYPLLIITRLPGQPLNPDRFPPRPVPATTLNQMLAALSALHLWQPAARLPDDSDYPAQFAGLPGALIPPAELARITRLCQATMPAVQLEHGDAHLANALATPAGTALIDLECTARRPAGYDLAKLWIFLAASPARRPAIIAAAGTHPQQQAGFWVAAALVAAREITSHTRHPGLPARAQRLRQLHADLRAALTRIRNLDQLT
jgi:Phosphotransferase enzyme family